MENRSLRPKVCVLIDTKILGGPGRGIFQLLQRSQEVGFEYILVNFDYSGIASEFNSLALAEGLRLRTIPGGNLLSLPRALKDLKAILHEERCSIIQTHGYKTHLLGALVRFSMGIPWIAFAHGWTTEDLKVRIYHLIDHLTLKFPQIAVAVSTPLFASLTKIRGESKKTVFVPNAVDPESIPGSGIVGKVRRELGIPPGELVIGCFGRLSSEKGQRVLLGAILGGREPLPALHVILVGDGPDRTALESLVKGSPFASRVHFVGHQRSMRDYFEAIDLYVLPSLSEGLPNVVLEAMAFERAVLATRVGSVPEVVSPGSGFLVEPNSQEALRSGLSIALKDLPKLVALGKEGKRIVTERFSPLERAKKIMTLYASLTTSGN